MDNYMFPDRYSRQELDWVTPGRGNRSPSESTYGFSEYFLWRTKEVRPTKPGGIHASYDEGISAEYSDRLREQNRDAFDRAVREVGRSDEAMADPTSASRFMTVYFGKKTKVVAVARGCNVGNGFPYWIVWFKTASRKTASPKTTEQKS
jgi:hypothetical protein